ncbi:MAG: flagellar basal body-associated protein FliL [Vicinamibacterales bacterium]
MSEKPAAAANAKGGKSKMIPIVAAIVLLGAAGGGYYWYAAKAAAAEAEAAEDDADEDEGDHADDGDDEATRVRADDDDHGDAVQKKSKKKRKKKKASGGEHHARLMSFEPFVVNLADPGAARFLRTNVQLVVSGGEEGGSHGAAKGPTVEEMRARSAILELLSAETSDALTTPEGKEALKEQILERMEVVLEAAKIEVEDVLFSDFVIQF